MPSRNPEGSDSEPPVADSPSGRPAESDLIYDWNQAPRIDPRSRWIELDDETLRDGLQSPSAKSPSIEDKLEIVHFMHDLGIDGADIGLPAAGRHVFEDVLRIAREIVDQKLAVVPNCAARTVVADCEPIVEISQRVGIPVEVAAFIGSSPIRQYAEEWDVDRLVRLTHEAVSYCTRNDLPVMYVTEDTTRAKPDDLRRLYSAAIEAGARRICVADTVGHATPEGAAAVVRFVRKVVAESGEDVKVDWHGHRDRGLDVANALAAVEAGADRLHGTCLGIGERVGNTPIDLLLVNLELLGWSNRDLTRLSEYCHKVHQCTGVPFPDNYPVVGGDAFRTGTGVHAAAIIKAREKGDDWLADRVYSSVPASMVGANQIIEVGPMCGLSNVVHWLQERGIEADEELVQRIFAAAKDAASVLAEDEILALVTKHEARGSLPQTVT
ncbi:MAG: LeuA family protein [Thermoanaerobaculia bacterium]|nr:LeuA family protein [Thermoanaerobaculia bacterium]